MVGGIELDYTVGEKVQRSQLNITLNLSTC